MHERGSAEVLIDGLVRQTTLLIGQVSTTAGVRAPLSHVADRVFLELARELESQGIGKKVAADMFGMALRSYQKRVLRIQESLSMRDQTLWEAVVQFLGDNRGITRRRVLDRFHRDPEDQVAAVLNDLVQSGLVYCTGRGQQAVLGLSSDEDRRAVAAAAEFDALCNLAWLVIYQRGTISGDALANELGSDARVLQPALEHLIDSARIEVQETDAGVRSYSTRKLTIAAESSAGWEAAFLDHFRAVTTALSHKLRLGFGEPTPGVGGVTYTFDVYPGHPHFEEVTSLLSTLRQRLDTLFDAVTSHNESAPPPPDAQRISFYLGQNLADDSEGSGT